MEALYVFGGGVEVFEHSPVKRHLFVRVTQQVPQFLKLPLEELFAPVPLRFLEMPVVIKRLAPAQGRFVKRIQMRKVQLSVQRQPDLPRMSSPDFRVKMPVSSWSTDP